VPARSRHQSEPRAQPLLVSATHLERVGVADGGVEVAVGGRVLRLTNLRKPMYPMAGVSKGQVIDYYAQVADVILPHVGGRPLTMKRFPDGLGGAYFYEKQCPAHRPDWMRTVPIFSERHGHALEYCVATEAASLVWLANLANLELHPALGLAADVDVPTGVVFDIDPGYPATLLACCRVALLLRGLFETLALRSFVKSSGSKGLHVYVPLNAGLPYGRTKAFAREVAETIAARFPELVTANMARARRAGKVLIDWSQNARHKTTVAPYSLRAKDPPTVSKPLEWEEVQAAAESGRTEGLVATPQEMLASIRDRGDVLAESVRLRQELPA